MSWQGLSTWYTMIEGENTDGPPLIVCHGGPGATHDEIEAFADLHRDNRVVILYDQVGNGRSSLRPEAPPGFWTMDLFLTELRLLLEHLGLASRYHLAGHSWGGMLAMQHATTQPPGLKSLVLCNTRPSLGGDITESEAPDLSTPEGQAFLQEFMAEHVCRVQPPPAGYLRTAEARKAHPEVFAAMNGPSPFELVGSLRGWDVRPRLAAIDVPALVVTGTYDLIPPSVAADLTGRLPRAVMHEFKESSHMPFVEEPEAFLDIVGAFLDDVDQTSR